MAKLYEVISGCNTGQIEGLSTQVLEKIIATKPGTLSRIDHPLIVCEGSQNNPYLQAKAYESLVKVVEARGVPLHINSCLRTPMQQYMLRQQYERGLCGIRAAAPPPLSNHNSALAIDVQDSPGWRSYMNRFNWRWIGSFDPMHYDFKGGGENLGPLQVRAFQELWNEYNPDDQMAVDGSWGPATASKVRKAPAQGFGNMPTLRKGMFSSEVGALQLLLRKALNLKPADLNADKHFGAGTFKALVQFQELHGLGADGVAGPTTIAKLEEMAGETISGAHLGATQAPPARAPKAAPPAPARRWRRGRPRSCPGGAAPGCSGWAGREAAAGRG